MSIRFSTRARARAPCRGAGNRKHNKELLYYLKLISTVLEYASILLNRGKILSYLGQIGDDGRQVVDGDGS